MFAPKTKTKNDIFETDNYLTYLILYINGVYQ